MKPIVSRFCEYYRELTLENLERLDEIYAIQAKFIDPIDEINGLEKIHSYFHKMLNDCKYCHFDITDVVEKDDQAFISWTMHFAHPKLNHGSEINVDGSTHIKFFERINYHRDYYDVGQMVYEHIPIIKHLIKYIKNGLST